MIVTTIGTSCITLSAVSSNLRSHNEYVEALLKLVNYQPWGFRFPTDDKFNFPRGSIHGFVTKFLQLLQLWGGCSPGGRAGYLQIGRLVVQSLSVPFLRGILTLMQPSDCECLQMMDRSTRTNKVVCSVLQICRYLKPKFLRLRWKVLDQWILLQTSLLESLALMLACMTVTVHAACRVCDRE